MDFGYEELEDAAAYVRRAAYMEWTPAQWAAELVRRDRRIRFLTSSLNLRTGDMPTSVEPYRNAKEMKAR